jgi:TPR repeat protein
MWGAFYDLGIGAQENYELAVYWYRKASERGSADAT